MLHIINICLTLENNNYKIVQTLKLSNNAKQHVKKREEITKARS